MNNLSSSFYQILPNQSLHRIGRTGRMNKNTQKVSKGQAYTLFLNENKCYDFANLLYDFFVRQGIIDNNASKDKNECFQELLNLARKSKYYGTTNNGGGGKKRNYYGIGYN